jgi:peptidoglycan/xylan/chitin deacetylase (PgdA/CDA1 family)
MRSESDASRPDAQGRYHLTYHSFVTGESGYTYELSVKQFREHLRLTETSLAPVYTFDDGHISSFEQAFPYLEQCGQKGIFFVTTDWIGRKDFMEWADVKELVGAGHEVQSHSRSHPMLTHCDDQKLRNELEGSRLDLEDRTGKKVESISMPGGRWNDRVIAACKDAGYLNVYTSDPQTLLDVYGMRVQGRINVTSEMSVEYLAELLRPGSSLMSRYRMRHALKGGLRKLIGDDAYHWFWGRVSGWEQRR